MLNVKSITKKIVLSVAMATLLIHAHADELPEMTLYKDPNCGCCTAYGEYLKNNGVKVTMINHSNMVEIKQKYGTIKGASCHTVVMDNYAVEGHVPIASIRKLWNDQPDIKGIALPGMPYNSPGMGPEKKGSLKIMQVDNSNNIDTIFNIE